MMDINQRIEYLRTQWSAFRLINTTPRPGCLESENFSTWQCCDFHKWAGQEDETMTTEAVAITLSILPNSQQDSEVPSMVLIEGELMSALSIRWWELIDEAVQKGVEGVGDLELENRKKIKNRLNRLAAEFYLLMGYKVKDGFDFTKSQHPQEKMCYYMAEIAYEEFMGDSPDCEEDEEDEEEEGGDRT